MSLSNILQLEELNFVNEFSLQFHASVEGIFARHLMTKLYPSLPQSGHSIQQAALARARRPHNCGQVAALEHAADAVQQRLEASRLTSCTSA